MRTCATNLLLCGMLVLIPFCATVSGQDKKAEAQKELLVIKALSWAINAAALSTDGERIVTGDYGGYSDFGPVVVFDVKTGKKLLTIVKAHGNINCDAVAFSPSGKRIASGGRDNLVKVWDAETGKALLTLRGHGDRVTSVAWSPDGKRLISCGSTVKVWDAETGKEVLDLAENAARARRLAISPDGKRIARSGNDKMIIWDAQTGVEVLTLKQPASGIAFSPDSKQLVSLTNHYVRKKPKDEYDVSSWSVRVWDVATGMQLRSIEGPKREILTTVAFSSDGKWMVAGGGVAYPSGAGNSGWQYGQARVWEVSTGREVAAFTAVSHFTGEANLASVAFTPDGNRIVAAAHGGTVHVWEFKKEDGKP